MAYVGGGLYGAGGLLVLLTVLLPGPSVAAPSWLVAIGVTAIVVAAFFLWAADHLRMPLWQYAIATSVGAVLVTIAVIGGGADHTATYGVLYAFVSTYGFYYYPWPIAWGLMTLTGAGFGLGLVWHDVEAPLTQWLMIVGASALAGGLVGTLGRRMRRMLADEQATVADLNEIDSWKTTFLRAVSHDLRAPLSTMLGMLMVVRDRGTQLSDDQRDDMIARAIEAGERLQQLVEDLLDLERIEAGEIEPRLASVELDQLVRDTLAGLDLGDHPVEVDLHPLTAAVEPTKIDRIVTNLVSNAIRHTPPHTRVDIRLRRHDHTAVLTVEDEGPGLPDHVRASLFDAYRGARQRGSVGLGLHLVRRFTELHGGTVAAIDRDGGGTRFDVTLPLGHPADDGS